MTGTASAVPAWVPILFGAAVWAAAAAAARILRRHEEARHEEARRDPGGPARLRRRERAAWRRLTRTPGLSGQLHQAAREEHAARCVARYCICEHDTGTGDGDA